MHAMIIRQIEAQRNGATPHVTPEERARYEDELAESASRRSAAEKKAAKLEAKLRTSERILETLIAMNKLLVNEKEADVDLDARRVRYDGRLNQLINELVVAITP